ncbi:MAG TPA: hypothetical protein VHX43_14265 [Xanthobacteraceae bacterium]|jgi:hypothetical protein|nr:hypothetical protein [Xanthobacteraceae bacterium]
MVNRRLPHTVAKCLPYARREREVRARRGFNVPKLRHMTACTAFVQFLAKSYFFQLRENLRRILFDYGQKLIDRANAAFKAAC